MESVQETFILEKLNNYNTCELLDNKTEIYNLNEISYNLSMILNKESVSGYDMKAVFYLFDVLFLSRSKTKIREKGLYNLSKTIKKCVKKMEQIEHGTDFSMLQEIPGIVIILLASRYIMCNEWLNKIDREDSFSGYNLYSTIREKFDDTQFLYRRYLAFIQNKIVEVKDKIEDDIRNNQQDILRV